MPRWVRYCLSYLCSSQGFLWFCQSYVKYLTSESLDKHGLLNKMWILCTNQTILYFPSETSHLFMVWVQVIKINIYQIFSKFLFLVSRNNTITDKYVKKMKAITCLIYCQSMVKIWNPYVYGITSCQHLKKEHIFLKVFKSLIKKLLYRYYCSTCCFKNEKKSINKKTR